jgi:hypothetical protein
VTGAAANRTREQPHGVGAVALDQAARIDAVVPGLRHFLDAAERHRRAVRALPAATGLPLPSRSTSTSVGLIQWTLPSSSVRYQVSATTMPWVSRRVAGSSI